MPGPPPAGVSSTLRWRSVAEALMSRASNAHRPDVSALPARLTPSGPGNISGKSVRTVARQIVGWEVMASGYGTAAARSRLWITAIVMPLTPLRASGRERYRKWMSFFPAVLDELQGVVGDQVAVPARNEGTLYPVIDRRRVPGLLRDFHFPGRI